MKHVVAVLVAFLRDAIKNGSGVAASVRCTSGPAPSP